MKTNPKLPKGFPTGVKDKNEKMICVGDIVRITSAYTDESDQWEVCFGKTAITIAGPSEEECLPYIGIFVRNSDGLEDSLFFYIEDSEFEVEICKQEEHIHYERH